MKSDLRGIHLVAILALAVSLAAVGWLAFTTWSHPRTAPPAAPAPADAPPAETQTNAAYEARMRALDTLRIELSKLDARIAKEQARLDELHADLDLPPNATGETSPSAFAARDLNRLRIEAQTEWLEVKTLYEGLAGLGAAQQPQALATSTSDATLSELINQEMAATRKLNDLRQIYAADHPELQRTVSSLETLQRQIQDRAQGDLQGLKAKMESKKAKVDSLQAEFERTAAQATKAAVHRRAYREAQRQLEPLRQARQQLAVRIMEEEVAAALLKKP